MIDIVIPIRDREINRLSICIDSIIKNSSKVKTITVVDYGSKKKIRISDLPKDQRISVLRVENKEWNKAHALNLGILKGSAEYIMTVDCDMILSKEIFDEIEKNLLENNLIIDTNVRRIKIEDVSNNQKDMLKKSKPWFNDSRIQLFNQANGGFQVYSRKVYNEIGGLNEWLGFYMGAIDNFMYYLARIRKMNVIDISYPLFHMEHDKKKEQNFNLTKEEQDIALGYKQYKARYLDNMIKNNISKNESKIGGEKPDRELLDKFIEEYNHKDEIIDKAIKEGKEIVEICGNLYKLEKEKPSILICVINNYPMIPSYFVWDLFNLYLRTKEIYPDIDIQQVDACSIVTMRNVAVRRALGDNPNKKVYKYFVALDTDHHYPHDFLLKFIDKMERLDLDILTGLTDSQRETNGEHLSTQYYKIQKDMNTKENCVFCPKSEDKIIQVEASGPVGMVMNTRIFHKLEFPYFLETYQVNKDKNEAVILGSDIYFCKKLKEAGIKINVDCSVDFPHQNPKSFFSRGKTINM